MQSAVFLFSGQGAQKVGMGKDLAAYSPLAKSLFEEADQILGKPLSQVMFEGPDEELTRTAWCQPALYTHGIACMKLLQAALPQLKPSSCAGLSLGEFTAHTAAASMDFKTGLQLVAKRGEFMEQACISTQGAMAAMIGGSDEAVIALAKQCNIDVANFNAPGQIVVSGSIEGVDQAVLLAKDHGIRMAKKLNVAGAYHSRLMQSAQDQLACELANISFSTPQVPVFCNYEARPVSTNDDIKSMCEKQVTGSVQWTASMQALVHSGHQLFIEFGPGKVLAGLMGRIHKDAQVISIEDVTSLEQAIDLLK